MRLVDRVMTYLDAGHTGTAPEIAAAIGVKNTRSVYDTLRNQRNRHGRTQVIGSVRIQTFGGGHVEVDSPVWAACGPAPVSPVVEPAEYHAGPLVKPWERELCPLAALVRAWVGQV
jgi:hypothetical protein